LILINPHHLSLKTLTTHKRKRLMHSFMIDNRYYFLKYPNDLRLEKQIIPEFFTVCK